MCALVNSFCSLTRVPSGSISGKVFITYTAASHQVAVRRIYPLFIIDTLHLFNQESGSCQ